MVENTPGSGRFWLWLLVAVMAALTARVATTGEWVQWPELSTLTVESALHDSILVDVRMRTRSGRVDGPIVQRLHPGSEVTFSASPDDPVCIRLIEPEERRVVSFQLDGSEQARSTAIRLGPSTLQRAPPGFVRCDEDLAGHRVRLVPGRYFEPDRPETVRRERILARERL